MGDGREEEGRRGRRGGGEEGCIPGPAAGGLAEDGGAPRADHDGLGVAEHRGDPEDLFQGLLADLFKLQICFEIFEYILLKYLSFIF